MTRLLFVLGLSLAAVLVSVLSAVGGLQVATWDRVKPGVAVIGVPVGGLTPDEAATRLGPRVASILDQPLELQLDERTWHTTARGLGLRLDTTDLVRAAYGVGRQGPPLMLLRDQFEALQVGKDVPITQTVDGARLDQLMTEIATDVNRTPENAQLDLSADGTVVFAPSQTGLMFDEAASRDAVAQALAAGVTKVPLVTHVLTPAIATLQVAAAHEQLMRILGDGVPVQVTAAERTWMLERSDLLTMLVLTPSSSADRPATVTLSEAPLRAFVQKVAAEIDQDPRDARFTWSAGQVSPLRLGHDGRTLDESAAGELVNSQILAGSRTIDLPVIPVRPAVATEDAARLGIPELIVESTTSFAGSIPEKAHNIQLAAQRLNGTMVPPGGTFSFNTEVGPTTLEAGFQWGFGLTTGAKGGVHTVPSVAGGICQVATTLFQPVFWAGYQLEARYSHLYWIPAYTSRGRVGLDATVDADAGLDFRWINPTNDYVLIQATTGADHVTFQLYGNKPAWRVMVNDPVISDTVAPDPTPEVQQEPLLPWGRVIPVESARDGFQVVNVRHVIPDDGSAARDLVLKSVYQPAHTVTLVGTGNAPGAVDVAAAVERVLASQHAVPAAAATTGAPAPATTFPTPNGPRSLAQIRDELRRAGWGGGSDEDALATYRHTAAAADH